MNQSRLLSWVRIVCTSTMYVSYNNGSWEWVESVKQPSRFVGRWWLYVAVKKIYIERQDMFTPIEDSFLVDSIDSDRTEPPFAEQGLHPWCMQFAPTLIYSFCGIRWDASFWYGYNVWIFRSCSLDCTYCKCFSNVFGNDINGIRIRLLRIDYYTHRNGNDPNADRFRKNRNDGPFDSR